METTRPEGETMAANGSGVRERVMPKGHDTAAPKFAKMTDEDKERADYAALHAARAKSLEQLYDYTKFHIQAYLTLGASYVAVANLKVGGSTGDLVVKLDPWWATLATIFFMIAGLAGGVIVSSITQFSAGGSSQEFLKLPIGPLWFKSCPGLVWTYIEHSAFWIGLFAAAVSVAVPRLCEENEPCKLVTYPVGVVGLLLAWLLGKYFWFRHVKTRDE
jgi:hypothetical protein